MSNKLDLIRDFSLLLFVVYSIGFLVWNIYLGQYGFFEYNFLQTRYISAGIIFILPLFLLFYPFSKIIREDGQGRFVFLTCFFVFLFIFAKFIFPRIPQYLGGGKPTFVSLLGDSAEQMPYLQNFDIGLQKNGEKGSVQTEATCLFYQNQEIVLIGVTSWKQENNSLLVSPRRIISLKKDQIRGLQLKGGFEGRVECPVLAFYSLYL